MTSTIVGPGPVERISWEQFLELPDLPDGRHAVALIDGEVIWMGSPSPDHEHALGNLYFALRTWIVAGGSGRALSRPVIRIGTRDRGYEGDLAWYADDALERDARGRTVPISVPTIAVEVLSPSNRFGEISRKSTDYAITGIAETWIIDPARMGATRFADLVNGVYTQVEDLDEGDVLASPLLSGFSILVANVLAD